MTQRETIVRVWWTEHGDPNPDWRYHLRVGDLDAEEAEELAATSEVEVFVTLRGGAVAGVFTDLDESNRHYQEMDVADVQQSEAVKSWSRHTITLPIYRPELVNGLRRIVDALDGHDSFATADWAAVIHEAIDALTCPLNGRTKG